jgi:integrase
MLLFLFRFWCPAAGFQGNALETLHTMPKRARVDLAAALAAAPADTVERLTLAELVGAYFARNPRADGRERAQKWLEVFGQQDAWTIPAEDLARAADALVAGGYAPGSVNRDLGVLGSAYRWAKRQRICPRGFTSPTLAIRRYAEPVRRVHISAAELAAIRAGALTSKSRGFGAFVACLIDSGARKSEVLLRTWGDLDADAGTLTAMTTKTGRPRVLFLREETVRLVQRLGGRNPPEDALIFRGRTRYQPVNYRKSWARLVQDIGRPDLHLHDLRHAAAADLLRAGVSAPVAAQVLGHSVGMLTERYGHLEIGALRAAMETRWAA